MAKIKDLTMLSDIFPTGYHGAYTAGVTTGSTVYVAGAGPVGLACAASAHLLAGGSGDCGGSEPGTVGASAQLRLRDYRPHARCHASEQIEQLLGEPLVDAAVDCVGFEARGHGTHAGEAPATVLNDVMTITRAGGQVGIPGLYVTGDPGGIDENAKIGRLGVRIGLGWAKSLAFVTGQCPVMRYHRQLMMAILQDKIQIARAVNATVITLDQAPQGYQDFDKGAAKKFVLNPHGLIAG